MKAEGRGWMPLDSIGACEPIIYCGRQEAARVRNSAESGAPAGKLNANSEGIQSVFRMNVAT